MQKYLIFVSIGFELIGLVLAGIYVSGWLEERYKTGGFITMGVLFLVLIGWFVHITYMLKKAQKNTDDSSANH